MSVALTDRQEMFCREFLIDLNATQAAIRAGYSPKTARTQAAQLLAKRNINDRVADLKKERADRLEVSADAVLRRYYDIAFSKGLGEFIEVKEGKFQLRAEIEEARLFLLSELIPGEWGYRVKVLSILEALNKLGEHLGLFRTNDHLDTDALPVMAPPPAVEYHPVNARLRDDPESKSGKTERSS